MGMRLLNSYRLGYKDRYILTHSSYSLLLLILFPPPFLSFLPSSPCRFSSCLFFMSLALCSLPYPLLLFFLPSFSLSTLLFPLTPLHLFSPPMSPSPNLPLLPLYSTSPLTPFLSPPFSLSPLLTPPPVHQQDNASLAPSSHTLP